MATSGPRPTLSILRVDDSADTVETSAALLRLFGYEVRTARSGAEALALLDGWQPEVALLDLRMPGMDGYELARCLCERPGGRPLLIAITGACTRADRERAEAAGFDHYLMKPVDPDALTGLLRDHAASLAGKPRR